MSESVEKRPVPLTRRQFAALAGGAFATAAIGGACAAAGEPLSREHVDGQLTARPRELPSTIAKGTRALGLGKRDAVLQMPYGAPAGPLPLLILLHGAGGSGHGVLERLGESARAAGLAVLAPDSRGSTWDAIRGGFGPDARFIDGALGAVFNTVQVDPRRIAIGGFSDGASYAISLGLITGDLFRRVIAFSPGFLVPGQPRGRPEIYVSHGERDSILPIDRCSRRLVPLLRQAGYAVTFREFAGGHEVPGEIAGEGMNLVAAR